MALGNAKRFNVFKRDGFTCQYCGRRPPDVILEVDHVQPRAAGGDDDPLNLVTACFECNRGKRDNPLSEVLPARGEVIKRERERARQTEKCNAYLMEIRRAADAAIEELGLYWFNQIEKEQNSFVFGKAREVSIRRFLKHLTSAEICEAIDIASAKFGAKVRAGRSDFNMWRYFCGICWRLITAKEIEANKGGGNGAD